MQSSIHSHPHATKQMKQMKTSLFMSVYTESGVKATLGLYFTLLQCAHNHFITASLPSNSYIFCTSDLHHMDRATSTVSHLSLAICAHHGYIFRNILWGVNGFCTWACTPYLFIYLIFRCSAPLTRRAVGCSSLCTLQKFEDIFNWTPGITLKSL